MTISPERLRKLHYDFRLDSWDDLCDERLFVLAVIEELEQARTSLEGVRADAARYRTALESIMHARGDPNSPATNMGRGLMREIAGAALDHTQNPTESGDSCIRNGVAGSVNGVNEAALTPIDANDDYEPCAHCLGTGRLYLNVVGVPCPGCRGTGRAMLARAGGAA